MRSNMEYPCHTVTNIILDWCQCGKGLAPSYLAIDMELPDSVYMNSTSKFSLHFLKCSTSKSQIFKK